MRCGSAGIPPTTATNGRTQDPVAVGLALRQLLARSEITEPRALVVVGDEVATFRVLRLSPGLGESQVAAAVSREFPLDPERIATSWADLARSGDDQRLVYAVAWDRGRVKVLTDAVRSAGVEPEVVDLKSACLARAVSERSCVIIDLTSNPADAVVVDEHVPQLWHSFELKVSPADDLTGALASPLRSLLRFYGRLGDPLGPEAPVLIATEQVLTDEGMARLAQVAGRPVRPLPLPSRVPAEVRHSTYLACLGLMMRRT